MTKKISPANNQANQGNANKSTDGVNKQYAKVHSNSGNQLNKNRGDK
ncbi:MULTISPECIES: hypothetical protein [unclassified Pseudoalteromonas]|nr:MULTISPECIES: hypothetical protein [unclassified Pseudoalteromonas]KPZ52575.1 hypothetical protein AN389_03842 [Pseudoalteromonas sp. P1-7a]KPZ58208.1 hypothetical protein AN393_00016 [Pseudoalteromonas sp. P1-25]